MKNPPSFQFYPQDFMSDLNVVSMTDVEVGRYIKLLCLCWIEDGLPVENGSPLVEQWFKQNPILLRRFVVKEGKYRNPRLDRERQKQLEWQRKSAMGGLKSAESKRLLKGGSTKGQPTGNHPSTNGQLFCLQSLSSIKNHKNDSIKVEKFDPIFEKLWKEWPTEGRFKKKYCRMKFKALCKKGKLDEFKRTTRGYSDFLRQKANDGFAQQPMHLSTWLNNWEEDKERYINFKYKEPM